jgi:hypothetical protein
MDIYEFPIYDDAFSADEFADDTEGFGAIDDLDLHDGDRGAYLDGELDPEPQP